MSSAPPKVLILGHSFIRRLLCDLSTNFDSRARSDLKLSDRADISMFGVGGRTSKKLKRFNLHVTDRLDPHIIIPKCRQFQ